MLRGQRYLPDDPDLVADRRACRRLVAAFNDTAPDDDDRRRDLLGQLLGSFGAGSVIEPRFCCDYGKHIGIGANCFINYDAVLLDCAPITIGDHVSIGADTVVGAGSVVTRDLPAGVLAAGNPCRVIRSLG
jgi:maltose O-acetyltransferase